MLLSDEVLLEPLLLEVSDPLWSGSFPLVRCACWLFLSSRVFLSPKSVSTSSCYDHVPCSVANSVVNVVMFELLGALLLRLFLFRGDCG